MTGEVSDSSQRKNALGVRAAEYGRSAKAEHREILRAALPGDDQLAARQQAAERPAEFCRCTAGRGSSPALDLLAESRPGRLRAPIGDDHGGGDGA